MLELTASLDDCIEELTRAMECARRNIEQAREKEDDEINLSAWSTDDEVDQPDRSEVAMVPTKSSNLTILESMGFHDTNLNERLLKRMKGNIDAVVEKLLSMVSRESEESRTHLTSTTAERTSIRASTSRPSNSSADMETELDFHKLISFLQGQKSGQDLVSTVCSRYNVAVSDNAPDYILHQIALSCIFNPALENSTSEKSMNLRPKSLMDVEDVKQFQLTFLHDDGGIVRWLQADAIIAGEPFRALCIACSHCGSSFSGSIVQSPDASIEGSWKSVGKGKAREAQMHRKRPGNVSDQMDLRLCTPCFHNYASKGSLINIGRCAVEKLPEMFPDGAVKIIARSSGGSGGSGGSFYANPSKRKRTLTSRWDPTDDNGRGKRAQAESRANGGQSRMNSREGPIALDTRAVSNEQNRRESVQKPGTSKAAAHKSQRFPSPISLNQDGTLTTEDPAHVSPSDSPVETVKSRDMGESASLRIKNSMRCQVCFEDCDAEDLTLCNVCNISVHRSCYMGENEEIDQTVGWKCDPCKYEADFCFTSCRVCPVKGGAFKRIVGASNDWVHLPCAIWVPGLYVEDEVTMELVKGIDNVEQQCFGKICCICEDSTGCTIQCTYPGCTKRWHAVCGLESRWHMRISVENDRDIAFCRTTLCSDHSPQNSQESANAENLSQSKVVQQPVDVPMDECPSADKNDLCSCQVPWDGIAFMIQCDWCEIWFHGTCVGIQEQDISTMDTFVCQKCRPAPDQLKTSKIGQNTVVCNDPSRLKDKEPETSATANKESQGTLVLGKETEGPAAMKDSNSQDISRNSVDENETAECDFESETCLFDSSMKQSKIFPRKLLPEEARFILDQRPAGEAEHRRAAPNVWKKTAMELSSKFGVSIQAVFNIWEGRRWLSIANKPEQAERDAKSMEADPDILAEACDNVESCFDIQACLVKFLGSLLSEVIDNDTFISTELLLEKFKKLVSSEGSTLPGSFQQLSSFGRHLKSIDGMVRKKVGGVSGFTVNISLLQCYLSSQEGSIPKQLAKVNELASSEPASLQNQVSEDMRRRTPKRSLSKALGTVPSDSNAEGDKDGAGTDEDQDSGAEVDPTTLKPKTGLRVLYKWNDVEWYEGTIGKCRAKASYYNNHYRTKRSDWWSVTWDDGATSLILLSAVTKSNWFVFHAEGPKPSIYEKLPLVFAGSRHGVTGERIVREKNPISPVPMASAGSSPNDSRKSSGVVKNAVPVGGSDDPEIVAAIHIGEFTPVKVLCEGKGHAVHGLLKKEGDKIVVKHKGSLYSIKKFARLACADQEFSAAEKIRIRETGETLQKFLDAAAATSRTDSRSTRRSSSGESRSAGTHFFDEETPG